MAQVRLNLPQVQFRLLNSNVTKIVADTIRIYFAILIYETVVYDL